MFKKSLCLFIIFVLTFSTTYANNVPAFSNSDFENGQLNGWQSVATAKSLDGKLSDKYEELGRIYYKQLNGAEVEISKIDAILSEINALKYEKKALKAEIQADKERRAEEKNRATEEQAQSEETKDEAKEA